MLSPARGSGYVARTLVETFRFSTVADFGSCQSVCRLWRAVADADSVWAELYEHTQHAAKEEIASSLKPLIERPFGEDAVGWRVSVLQDHDQNSGQAHASGCISAYDCNRDAYLVAYDDDTLGSIWEFERRRHTIAMHYNPSLAGKSRFSFMTPPTSMVLERESNSREGASILPEDLLRLKSWKNELEHNVQNTPSRLLQRIDLHSDEVLFVVFSPCGMRLASCSRDLRTSVFRLRWDCSSDNTLGAASCDALPANLRFEQEAMLYHDTAPCRAVWWPYAPYDTVIVMTQANGGGWQGEATIEIWQIMRAEGPCCDESQSEELLTTQTSSSSVLDNQTFNGNNARCIFKALNRPFDIYTAFISWPNAEAPESADTCFLSGRSVGGSSDRYVQWLNVWPGPRHPKFIPYFHQQTGLSLPPAQPLAKLRLETTQHYFICLEAGPQGSDGCKMLSLTGNTFCLCNQIGIIDLADRRCMNDDRQDCKVLSYELTAQVTSLENRRVLSAKWSRRGDFILANSRPFVAASPNRCPARSQHAMEDMLKSPDLSTALELLVLDAATMECVGIFDGHFAFTTKESPFVIFTDDWADSDFLASGGEDGHVYIWHRRHRRLLQRLSGHTDSVNSVSWNGAGLLASASDDHTVAVWMTGGAAAQNIRQ